MEEGYGVKRHFQQSISNIAVLQLNIEIFRTIASSIKNFFRTFFNN
jgi:hypothetical protein